MINVIGFAVLIAASFFGQPAAGKLPRLEAGDLKRLTGAQWKGTLTYLDYGKNKKVSIPSNLTVTGPGAADAHSWTFDYQYPDEPKANSKDAVVVGGGGTTIDGERVVERAIAPDGTLKIVTEKAGADNDKPSLFRFTYLVGATTFSIKKEVRHEGAAGFFERNEYSWRR